MAMDVLSEIKAAEEKALEIRRTAAMAAKDALKLAEQENAQIMEKEIAAARGAASQRIEAAKAADKAALDKQQAQRLLDCDALKSAAAARLDAAVQICLEKVLK